MTWDKEKVKSILPQREPFLFIDEVIEVDEGKRIVAKKYLDPKADFFKGHFPGNPVMPGVLTIEAMAQAAILVYSTAKPEIAKKRPDYYFGSVKAKFKLPVFPNETLILEAEIIKVTDFGGVVDTIARVKDKVVAQASSTFGVKLRDE
ncbi:MAG: 3-hydroxyacyl-ACP dehydratase FabZ [Candidatus Omnitrophica bacterium]|nr:3-hydroxyacyl-ACP dehydratase FabZ [Candidatus Omnitrophota bacterium]